MKIIQCVMFYTHSVISRPSEGQWMCQGGRERVRQSKR